MMLDHLGEMGASQAVEAAIKTLLSDGRLRGVGTGEHKTSEVGDLVCAELRATAKV